MAGARQSYTVVLVMADEDNWRSNADLDMTIGQDIALRMCRLRLPSHSELGGLRERQCRPTGSSSHTVRAADLALSLSHDPELCTAPRECAARLFPRASHAQLSLQDSPWTASALATLHLTRFQFIPSFAGGTKQNSHPVGPLAKSQQVGACQHLAVLGGPIQYSRTSTRDPVLGTRFYHSDSGTAGTIVAQVRRRQ